MLRISLFECFLCWSDVVLSCVVFVCGHVSLVDYACDEAVFVERALVFFFYSCIRFAVECCCWLGFSCYNC